MSKRLSQRWICMRALPVARETAERLPPAKEWGAVSEPEADDAGQ